MPETQPVSRADARQVRTPADAHDGSAAPPPSRAAPGDGRRPQPEVSASASLVTDICRAVAASRRMPDLLAQTLGLLAAQPGVRGGLAAWTGTGACEITTWPDTGGEMALAARIAARVQDARPGRAVLLCGEGGAEATLACGCGGTEKARGWIACVVAPWVAGSLVDPLEVIAHVVGLAAQGLATRRTVLRLWQRQRTTLARLRQTALSEARRRERDAALLVEGERQFLAQERREGVDQLAAGVAHLLGNPLGALQANLEFVASLLAETKSGGGLDAEDQDEIVEAIQDALGDAGRISEVVSSAFQGAARQRLASVRTQVTAAVQDALDHFRNLDSGRVPVWTDVPPGLTVAVARGELARWLFRLLSTVRERDGLAVHLHARPDPEGRPAIRLRASEAGEQTFRTPPPALVAEIEAAEGFLRREKRAGVESLVLSLPRPIGEGAPAPRRSS